ncbi:MAG: hypothetical protein ACRD9R_20325 [Pyrinomonadaceae bacterium]
MSKETTNISVIGAGFARSTPPAACAVEGAANFDDGHQTQLVLDAARRSRESGCWAKPGSVKPDDGEQRQA